MSALRRFTVMALALLALVVVGCSFGEGETGASQEEMKAPEGTFELPNGRSLHIECLGSGSPTVVLEAGEATPGNYMSGFQKILADLRTHTDTVIATPPQDLQAFQAALGPIGQGCQGCHQAYRLSNN